MRKIRAKRLRRAAVATAKAGYIKPEQVRNFYRYLKRSWNSGRYKKLPAFPVTDGLSRLSR